MTLTTMVQIIPTKEQINPNEGTKRDTSKAKTIMVILIIQDAVFTANSFERCGAIISSSPIDKGNMYKVALEKAVETINHVSNRQILAA